MSGAYVIRDEHTSSRFTSVRATRKSCQQTIKRDFWHWNDDPNGSTTLFAVQS